MSWDILPAEVCAEIARISNARGTVLGTSDCSAGPSNVRAMAFTSSSAKIISTDRSDMIASTSSPTETLSSIA